MSTPAFRLRLPCIPYVPAIEGSLISSCLVDPPPGPCFIPPVPPPPPPSFGCYELRVTAQTSSGGLDFHIEADVTYPDRDETGLCEPIVNITLFTPSGKDSDKSRQPGGGGGGGVSGSSSSGSGGPGLPSTPGRTAFYVLVDVECDDYTCEITKYFKKLEYNNSSYIVFWMPPDPPSGLGVIGDVIYAQ